MEISMIIELILLECKKILLELQNNEDETNVNNCVYPPKEAIVKYQDGFSESKPHFGKVLKTWKIGLNEIQSLHGLNIENIKKPDGGFFQQAIFMFSINIEKKKIIITFQPGPRCGAGSLYSISLHENEYRIYHEKYLWFF